MSFSGHPARLRANRWTSEASPPRQSLRGKGRSPRPHLIHARSAHLVSLGSWGPVGGVGGAQGLRVACASTLRGLTSCSCLSAESEANAASSARHPQDRAPQSSPGDRRDRRIRGRLFLVTSFGEAKEVTRLPGRIPGAASRSETTHAMRMHAPALRQAQCERDRRHAMSSCHDRAKASTGSARTGWGACEESMLHTTAVQGLRYLSPNGGRRSPTKRHALAQ